VFRSNSRKPFYAVLFCCRYESFGFSLERFFTIIYELGRYAPSTFTFTFFVLRQRTGRAAVEWNGCEPIVSVGRTRAGGEKNRNVVLPTSVFRGPRAWHVLVSSDRRCRFSLFLSLSLTSAIDKSSSADRSRAAERDRRAAAAAAAAVAINFRRTVVAVPIALLIVFVVRTRPGLNRETTGTFL